MRLLLIEDDPMIGDSVQEGLRSENYAVDWVRDGRNAELALLGLEYDLLLLDLGLPGKTGPEVLKGLRAGGIDSAVMIITARDSTSARIEGLDSGADDYLVKPFDLNEMLARVRALLRRRAARTRSSNTVC